MQHSNIVKIGTKSVPETVPRVYVGTVDYVLSVPNLNNFGAAAADLAVLWDTFFLKKVKHLQRDTFFL